MDGIVLKSLLDLRCDLTLLPRPTQGLLTKRAEQTQLPLTSPERGSSGAAVHG